MDIKPIPFISKLQFNWRTAFKIFLSIVITIITLFYLLNYIPLSELLKSIQEASPLIIFSCSLFFLINFFFRAFRIYFLLAKKIDFPTLYLITIIHNSLTQLLPFRLGEFSFFYFTNKTKRVEFIDAVFALITARFFDVMTIIIITTLSYLLLEDPRFPHMNKLILFLTIFFLGSCVLFFYFRRDSKIKDENNNENGKSKFFLQFIGMINKIFLFLQSFKSKMFIFILAFSSLCIWGSFYLFMYAFYRYIGVSLPLTTFIFITSLTALFAIIPFQGIAGFGNVEISWGFLLILFGIESILALKSTVFIHVINTFSILFICILGLILLRFRENFECLK